MKSPRLLVLFALAAMAPHRVHAATGPVVTIPDNAYENCKVGLYPATTNGTWTIDWGDGTAVSAVPTSQLEAAHDYFTPGVYEIKATLRNSGNITVDVQRNYSGLVKKTGPALYYNFNDSTGSEHVGPVYTKQGGVTEVLSFAGSAGNAVRLAGSGYLRLADQSPKNADFFGLEFWLKPNNLTGKQVIYSGIGTASGNVSVYLENGKLCFELAGGGIKTMDLGPDVKTGRWYHFGVSYERSPIFKIRNAVRLYRDGHLYSEQTFTAAQSQPVNHTGATIGVRNSGTLASPVLANYLNADIDEIVLHPLGIFPGTFLERYQAAVSNQASAKVAAGADGCGEFTVDLPNITQPEVPVLLDPTPTVDNLPKIQAAIDSAAAGTRLKFVDKNTGLGGGTYYLRSVDQSGYWKLIKIKNKVDLEIDGNGTQLLVVNFAAKYMEIAGCTRLAVKNLSFDIDQTKGRVGAYAEVSSIDPTNNKLSVRWVKGSALVPDVVPSGMAIWRWRVVDRVNRLTIAGVDLDAASKTVDPNDGSLWTFTLNSATAPAVWTQLASIKASGDLLQSNNAHWGGSGVSMWSCNHTTFDRVNFYAVTGMVFLSSDFDYLKVSNSRVGLPPGMSAEDRPYASGSDGFHFHDADGGHVLFENNDVALTDDDPISFKGGVWRNVKKVDSNQLDMPSIGVGTVIELRTTNLEQLAPPFTATVTAYDTATWRATLDQPVPGAVGATYHLLNRSKYTGSWILRGNNFHDLNGRMMIYTPDGSFVNNRSTGIYFHIGFSAGSYDNAGEPYNIVVSNNFLRNGYNDLAPWEAWPSNPIIDDISLTNNSFIGSYWIFNATNRTHAVNNYSERLNTGSSNGLFHLTTSKKVNIQGNSLYDPVTSKVVSRSDSSDFVAASNPVIPARGTAQDLIVDNTSAAFTGSWTASTWYTGKYYGTNYHVSSASGASVKYMPAIPKTAVYRVYAMWSSEAARAATASYVVTHAGGTSTVVKSQRTGGALWVYLGDFLFDAGSSGNVTLATAGAGGVVIADALRFQELGDGFALFQNPQNGVVVDNTDAGATFTGTWGTSTGFPTQLYGTNVRWASPGSATATFTPTLGSTGIYQVYARWTSDQWRASNATYVISHAGGTTTVTRNQRNNGGSWMHLGGYTFNAGTTGNVQVVAASADGTVVADAIGFQR